MTGVRIILVTRVVAVGGEVELVEEVVVLFGEEVGAEFDREPAGPGVGDEAGDSSI